MRTEELRELLNFSVLAPNELVINGITSTQFCLSLWRELNKKDRQELVVLLTKAHKRLATKIRRVALKNLDGILNHCNLILTREAMMAGAYPQFRRQAVGLKDIFLEAIMDRWNKGQRPGASMTVEQIAQMFRDVLRERGLESVKTVN